jgi:hypothetical protein
MKKISALIFISFLLSSCSQIFFTKPCVVEEQASEEFAQGSEDIPLLVGMEKISEESLGFDSDLGSIISSSYDTKIELQKVKTFYLKTLPQMGWVLVKDVENSASFKREKEKLEIEFVKQDGKKLVRFFISSTL